jgi:hypothetical protein
MPTVEPMPQNSQQPMTFDSAPAEQPMTFDSAPTQQPMTFDSAPAQQPSLLQRGVDLVSKIPLVQFGIGAVKSAEEGLGGAIQAGTQNSQQREQARASSLGVENQATPPPAAPDAYDQTAQALADWLKKNTQRQGFIQKSGAAAEIMGELFGGGEATQAASLPDKLIEVGRTIKAIESTPALQRLISRAVTSGTRGAVETGAQQYVRTGGDPEATATAAATGGVVGGAAGAVSEGLNMLRPSSTTIGGVDVPITAAQRPNAPAITRLTTPAEDIPAIAEAQQAAAPQIIQNTARRALGNVLDDVNVTRGQMQGPAEEAGIQPGTFKFSVAPHGGEPVETTDPNFVQKLLNEARDITESDGFDQLGPRQQQRVTGTVDDLQSQLDQYHQELAERPHFTPIDVQSALNSTDNLHTAGDIMQNSVDDIYQRMRGAAKEQLNVPRLNSLKPDQFNQLMEENSDQFSPEERQVATDTFRKGVALKELHEAIQQGFNVSPQYAADTGAARTFTGSNRIANSIDDVLERHGDDLTDMLGTDGISSLRRMNELLKSPDTGGVLQQLLRATGSSLRHHYGGIFGLAGLGGSAAIGGVAAHALGVPPMVGAAGGAATGYALRKVIDKVATNPMIADRVAYAVEHSIAPRVAAPLIANMMIRSDAQRRGGQ